MPLPNFLVPRRALRLFYCLKFNLFQLAFPWQRWLTLQIIWVIGYLIFLLLSNPMILEELQQPIKFTGLLSNRLAQVATSISPFTAVLTNLWQIAEVGLPTVFKIINTVITNTLTNRREWEGLLSTDTWYSIWQEVMGSIHFSNKNNLCILGINFSLAWHVINKYSFLLPHISTTHFNCEISHPQNDIKIPEDWDKKSLAIKKPKDHFCSSLCK